MLERAEILSVITMANGMIGDSKEEEKNDLNPVG
jgi:hypothetical protein